jgi:hypothetical protein
MKKIMKMFDLRKGKTDIGTYAVAVHLSHEETKVTTITLSWRANSTKDNAVIDCLRYAAEQKPGYKVEQYLVEKIA